MRGDFTGLRSQRLTRLLQLLCALAPGPSSLASLALAPLSLASVPGSGLPWGLGQGCRAGMQQAGVCRKALRCWEKEELLRTQQALRAGGVQGLRGTAAGTVGGVSLCS